MMGKEEQYSLKSFTILDLRLVKPVGDHYQQTGSKFFQFRPITTVVDVIRSIFSTLPLFINGLTGFQNL